MKFVKWLAGGFLALLVALIIFGKIVGPVDPCTDKGTAYLNAIDYVQSALKAPATAKFASMHESKIEPGKNCDFHIEGWVDAQNSYGALIRNYYMMDVYFDKPSNRWEALGPTLYMNIDRQAFRNWSNTLKAARAIGDQKASREPITTP